jgi:hypothetical protein
MNQEGPGRARKDNAYQNKLMRGAFVDVVSKNEDRCDVPRSQDALSKIQELIKC